jgi:hypothetical protein
MKGSANEIGAPLAQIQRWPKTKRPRAKCNPDRDNIIRSPDVAFELVWAGAEYRQQIFSNSDDLCPVG